MLVSSKSAILGNGRYWVTYTRLGKVCGIVPVYRKALGAVVALRQVGHSEEAYPEQVSITHTTRRTTHMINFIQGNVIGCISSYMYVYSSLRDGMDRR